MAIATDVLVIGAGPTGLTMATLLAHSGIRVRIVDKKAKPTQESRAVVIHAKILELLDKLDLTETAIENGEQLEAVQLFMDGKRTGRFSFLTGNRTAPTPYPFALIYGQDQTEHLLIQSLAEAGVQVEWNTELLSLEQTSDGTCTHFRTQDGGEEVIEASWIIGADGSRSPVRQALSLGFQGQTYAQTLFVADIDLEGDLGTQQGSLDLAHGFFLFMPMRDAGRYRLFGSLPPHMTHRETLTLDDVQQVLDMQSGLHVTLTKSHWIAVYRTHQRMAERFRSGRIFLVGDAAHIHSPAGGQGMNTGIGDAYNLAWKLALVVKGQALETLLDSYEAERLPFARIILNGSDRAFHFMITSEPLVRRLRSIAIPLVFRLLSVVPNSGQSALWLISQLWTSYRGSPAIADSGYTKKGPRAGDRAPYGVFETGPDSGKGLFTKLKDLDHHLLLFEGRNQTLENPYALEERLHMLLGKYDISIHLHFVTAGNRSLHQAYGADVPRMFLVRPDGQLAYQSWAQDLDGLQSYLDGLFHKSAGSLPEIETPRVISDSEQPSTAPVASTAMAQNERTSKGVR